MGARDSNMSRTHPLNDKGAPIAIVANVAVGSPSHGCHRFDCNHKLVKVKTLRKCKKNVLKVRDTNCLEPCSSFAVSQPIRAPPLSLSATVGVGGRCGRSSSESWSVVSSTLIII